MECLRNAVTTDRGKVQFADLIANMDSGKGTEVREAPRAEPIAPKASTASSYAADPKIHQKALEETWGGKTGAVKDALPPTQDALRQKIVSKQTATNLSALPYTKPQQVLETNPAFQQALAIEHKAISKKGF